MKILAKKFSIVAAATGTILSSCSKDLTTDVYNRLVGPPVDTLVKRVVVNEDSLREAALDSIVRQANERWRSLNELFPVHVKDYKGFEH